MIFLKNLDDLLEIYRTCYGELNTPRVVESVRAVPDFTAWLVQDAGVKVSGMARRVPDVHRPHRFMLQWSNLPPMPRARHACETDYKQHNADAAERKLAKHDLSVLCQSLFWTEVDVEVV